MSPAIKNNSKFKAPTILVLAACMSILVSGCSAPKSHELGFSDEQKIQGNSQTISASLDETWASVLEVMPERGWLIQQTDSKSHLILAHREIKDVDKKDYSHAISATVTVVPRGGQITQVILAANKTTELHKKSYKWWRLLWIIPIIPLGTEYTTVVVDRDTVHSPAFYQDFFTAIKKRADEKVEMRATSTSP